MLAPVGTIFIRLLTLVAIPLVFCSLTSSLRQWTDIRTVGKIGGVLLMFVSGMTAAAVVLGLALGLVFQPGAGMALDPSDQRIPNLPSAPAQSLTGMLVDLVPGNFFRAASDGNLLQVIIAAILFGWGMLQVGPAARDTLHRGLAAVSEVLFQLIHLILKLAPLGIAALIASAIGDRGIGVLIRLSYFVAVLFLGFAVHMLVVQGAWVAVYARIPLRSYLRKVRAALSTAFATTSTVASLPVSIESAENELKMPQATTRFVLPIACNIQREGGAVFQAVSALFIAQLFGIPITASLLAKVFVGGFLASVSTAGIPSGSVVNLSITLASAGLPLEGLGLIWAVDRVVDLFRTVVNLNGQLTALTVISKLFPAKT